MACDICQYLDGRAREGDGRGVGTLGRLLRTLSAYEEQRQRFVNCGGSPGSLESITDLLETEIAGENHGAGEKVSLDRADSVHRYLGSCKVHDLRYACDRDEYGFPVFYLCRLSGSRHSACATVVEDLYRSPDYRLSDERFLKGEGLRTVAPVRRLSPFRRASARLLGKEGGVSRDGLDRFLHELSRGVLGAAWREEQRVAIQTARWFGAPSFRRALELVSLVLGSDLCRLRAEVRKEWILFFGEVYEQPAIQAVLEALPGTDGNDLCRLRDIAADQYGLLQGELRIFLSTRVRRHQRRGSIALYKLIFGNMERLERISGELSDLEAVKTGSGRLESAALEAIRILLTHCGRRVGEGWRTKG